mmetsp:Transcript_36097/g.103803  ORF Transcript_36097/g.103803 Transcript_36097/m.103803 type:complete len:243 (-) Transcript_36097:818-1546(-)
MWAVELRGVGVCHVPQQGILAGPHLVSIVVGKKKAATLVHVPVAIHVEEQLLTCSPVQEQLLDSEDPFMLLCHRAPVATVEVEAERVEPRVAPRNTVRVQHGTDLEDKALPKCFSSWVIREDPLQEAIHREGAGRLARVHAARPEDHRAAREAQRRGLGRGAGPGGAHGRGHAVGRLLLVHGRLLVCRLRNCQHLHAPPPGREGDRLPMEVDPLPSPRHDVVPVARLEVADLSASWAFVLLI